MRLFPEPEIEESKLLNPIVQAIKDISRIWRSNFRDTGYKGDLPVGKGSQEVGRLPVGNDGQFLKATSTATLGVEWSDDKGYTDVVDYLATSYTATDEDYYILINKTVPFTLTLPAATGSARVLYVKNINSGAVTIDGNASEIIDSAETKTLAQWKGVQLIDYDTGKWAILGDV
jgi:hypothetical protein